MATLPFRQVDVFAPERHRGNPLAVVIGADALSDRQMASFASWTNLSETTFLLAPTRAECDYRVRIFTPSGELDFAGHPTLGSCHVWLGAGGVPRGAEIVQECGIGPVSIRRDGDALAFEAPPLRRSGPVEAATLDRIAGALGLGRDAILGSAWVDNGPGWVAIRLADRDAVLSLRPDFAALGDLALGVVGAWRADDGDDHGDDDENGADFEVRAFAPGHGVDEDPVTGSLNAGLACWLIGAGLAPDRYVARQGTALGRAGTVQVRRDGARIWIGGRTLDCIEGVAHF